MTDKFFVFFVMFAGLMLVVFGGGLFVSAIFAKWSRAPDPRPFQFRQTARVALGLLFLLANSLILFLFVLLPAASGYGAAVMILVSPVISFGLGLLNGYPLFKKGNRLAGAYRYSWLILFSFIIACVVYVYAQTF